MKADLKIPVVEIDGTQCILPEAFDVLMRFAEHRQLCSQCDDCFNHRGGAYCTTGDEINKELFAIPGVEFINVRE